MTFANPHAALVAIGGFAGTGKTAISRRLSAELGFPRLGSDDLGQTIRASAGFPDGAGGAYWIGYDVLFQLCADFLSAGISVIVDTNLGWEFQWRRLDAIREAQSAVVVVPILLRCPLDVCLERIALRHAADPRVAAPADRYLSQPKLDRVWEYLARLDRPDVQAIDASRPVDRVYADARACVTSRLVGLQHPIERAAPPIHGSRRNTDGI